MLNQNKSFNNTWYMLLSVYIFTILLCVVVYLDVLSLFYIIVLMPYPLYLTYSIYIEYCSLVKAKEINYNKWWLIVIFLPIFIILGVMFFSILSELDLVSLFSKEWWRW